MKPFWLTAALSMTFLVAILLPQPATFAQRGSVTVETDKTSYSTGETIRITGNVGTVQSGQQILIRVLDPLDVLVRVDQFSPAADGSYTYSFLTGGIMRNSGEHTVIATYGANSAETIFQYSYEPWNMFALEIDGVDYPIRYQITGGQVTDITAQPDSQTVTVSVSSASGGTLTMELPAEVIRAEDGDFSVSGSLEVEEQEPTSRGRVLAIEFYAGIQEIGIIGTYMIPEFGATAVILLGVSTVGIIVVTSSYSKFKNL